MLSLALHASSMAKASAAESSARGAKSEAMKLWQSVRELDDELARHALVLQTLLRICERKGLFKDPEFIQLLEQVDMEDGVRDGKRKRAKGPKTCPDCGKNARPTAMTCIYCGAEFPAKSTA